MSITKKVPGMKPGATIRNITLGVFYTFLLFGLMGAAIGDEETSSESQESVESEPVEEEEVETTDKETKKVDDGPSMLEMEQRFISSMESELDVDVTQATHKDGTFKVAINSDRTTQEEIMELIGGSVGAYSVVVAEEYGGEKMEVTLYTNNEKIGSYEATSKDAKSYHSGELSGEEFAVKVLQTIETVEE